MPTMAGIEPPSGIVTCLFSDIEGSTRMLRELGDAEFSEVLARHHELLRGCWAEHDGFEVKTIGDAFFVVFDDAEHAVAGAVAAQRALAEDGWPGRIRIGIHTGYARPLDGDYTALVVNQAARVVGAARGGQILLTEQTASAVEESRTEDDPGSVVQRLGRFRVRDFDSPVELCAAVGPGLSVVEAPPRVPPADGHNLPRPTTSLVDREEDLARICELLEPGRVVTLVGTGGVGKTRLAVEAVRGVASAWEDGAWFVDLAPIQDGALIAEAVSAAVGAPASAGGDRWPELLAHLEDQSALIYLDNCEHLAEESARVAVELISACPGVGVFATSRVPLEIRGECVHRLSPLVSEGAVELFLDRSSSEGEREEIGELCAELDGLPLAIELAAARTTALSVREILDQVRRSPEIVRSRDPSLPERQRSLERLFDWSLKLLPAPARSVLGRLSVFASGFDVDAAEAVAAAGDVAEAEVAGALWDLIDASLVRPMETAGTTRYRLLSTVRAHAGMRADSDDLSDATKRLASLLLERVGPLSARRNAWMVEMEFELDNVRAAAANVEDPHIAQALAWSIGRFHDLRDTYREGIGELRRFLDARPEPGPEKVAMLSLLADLHLRLGELGESDAALTEAEECASAVGNPEWDDAGVIRTRGELLLRRNDATGAAEIARAGLADARSPQGRARLFDLLGVASAALGDLEASAHAFIDELAEATAAGIETHLGTVHANLAETYLRLGNERGAAHHQAISLGLARDWESPVLIAFGLMVAARMGSARGRARDAVILQTKADALLADADYALYEADERIRSQLLSEASSNLGTDGFEAAVAAGAEVTADEAANLAEGVLSAVVSEIPSPEGRQRDG
jgi:predicted ATPase/class 3 adenylate cyclase